MSVSSTVTIGDLLKGRSFAPPSSIELPSPKDGSMTFTSSIEQPTRKRVSEQGEIPDSVDALIDNKMYRNRYKRLIREGHLQSLLYLVEYATTSGKVQKPSNWFVRSCSVANWEGTLRWVTRMLKVMRQAVTIADRLGKRTTRFILKQIHKGVNVEHLAALAKESGREPYKLFCWLCVHNPKGAKA